MKIFAFFILMAIGSTSWAIEKGDDITNISRDSKFVATSDLTVLANAKESRVAFTFVDRVFQSCSLFLQPSQSERVIETGSVLIVDKVERVKSGTMYPDGYAAVIYFNGSSDFLVPIEGEALACRSRTG